MKEVVYRKIFGNNPRKHEVSLEERSNRTELTVVKKKISKYFIKEKYISNSMQNLRSWVKTKKTEKVRKDCHVLRRVNTETGENKIICKILGEFFVIWGDTAYQVIYVNEIRIEIEALKKNSDRIRHIK